MRLSDEEISVLKTHLRIVEFPRDLLILNYAYDDKLRPIARRTKVYSMEQYEALHSIYSNRDIAVSIFSKPMQNYLIYDTILCDIDDVDLASAYKKAQKVISKLGNCRVYFSGKKGFHIFKDFKPVKINDYRVAVIRYITSLGIRDLVDISCFEPARVSRVPLSMHSGTKYYCIPVDIAWDLDTIIQKSKTNEKMTQTILRDEISFTKYDSNELSLVSVPLIKINEQEYPICIKNLLNKMRSGYLTHDERVVLCNFLLKVESIDSVTNRFRKMADFDEGYTKYQLQYLKQRQLRMHGCRKLIAMEMCTNKSNCIYYPSINSILGREKDNETN